MSSPAPSDSPWTESPALIFWELTRACELTCKHCRAEAIPDRQPGELTTEQISDCLARIGEETSCVVVFTGGDPFQRPDLPELVKSCSEAGLKPALTPSTTPRLTENRLKTLRQNGLKMLALSLDGPGEETQDDFRGQAGTFEHTQRGLEIARSLEIPLQINTTVCRETLPYIEEMGDFVADRDVFRWALFFLVRAGDGADLEGITARETEDLFRWLHDWSEETGITVKTTNAPHFNRWKIQQAGAAPRPGIVDGDGIMFISHRGDVYPSGFSESDQTHCGNVLEEFPLSIYREHPLFRDIRARRLDGKCGRCEYRRSCGGSRANALFETGDPLGTDPRCLYEPEQGEVAVS